MPIGTKPFRVELATPEWAADPMDCTFVALPAWDGQIGVLANRSPLVCKLAPGELRLETGGRFVSYYVQGGFAEVVDNVVTVMTERAVAAGDLSADAVKAELAAAKDLDARDEPARELREERIGRAKAQLAIIEKLAGR